MEHKSISKPDIDYGAILKLSGSAGNAAAILEPFWRRCYIISLTATYTSERRPGLKSKMIVTASIHVYSIQKVVLKDSGPLFNTDYDAIKENLNICSNFQVVYLHVNSKNVPRLLQVFLSLESLIIHPIASPFIYGVKTQATRKRIVTFFKGKKVLRITNPMKMNSSIELECFPLMSCVSLLKTVTPASRLQASNGT
ncbi:DNA polymerase delta subunit 3 [Acipenser ruthenus]|uniref:DNA polymerase delta subunit 3 n=1 Tax=Acipenser ruthenus TaxID=7906 RepID=A0A444UW46_ACIRT|nr:DNA polymerase delta subunit 3 [Acipenser ruthenus]